MSIPAFLAKLRLMGGVPAPGATDQEITATLQRLDCSVESTLHAFYKHSNGLSKATDDNFWDFYALSRLTRSPHSGPLILPGGQEISRSSLIRFCDGGLEAVSYAFCGDPELPYFGHIFGDEPMNGWLVAPSFAEFVEVFLSKADNLLLNYS